MPTRLLDRWTYHQCVVVWGRDAALVISWLASSISPANHPPYLRSITSSHWLYLPQKSYRRFSIPSTSVVSTVLFRHLVATLREFPVTWRFDLYADSPRWDSKKAYPLWSKSDGDLIRLHQPQVQSEKRSSSNRHPNQRSVLHLLPCCNNRTTKPFPRLSWR